MEVKLPPPDIHRVADILAMLRHARAMGRDVPFQYITVRDRKVFQGFVVVKTNRPMRQPEHLTYEQVEYWYRTNRVRLEEPMPSLMPNNYAG